jgi:hypothetical protein
MNPQYSAHVYKIAIQHTIELILYYVVTCVDSYTAQHRIDLVCWQNLGGRCGCDRDLMEVGFTTTCAISAYHHLSYEFETRSWRGVLDATRTSFLCGIRNVHHNTVIWFSFYNLERTIYPSISKIGYGMQNVK